MTLFSTLMPREVRGAARCAGYFLRKSPEIEDNARKMRFHSLLYLAEASYLGHPFVENDGFCERMPQVG